MQSDYEQFIKQAAEHEMSLPTLFDLDSLETSKESEVIAA